jgi:hypothetical protein
MGMESDTQHSQGILKPERRRTTYGTISTQLALLSNQRLSELLEKATPLHKGIGGTSAYIEICGKPVFAKKIPLTDLERRPDNIMSTANLFELPLYYQYGVGSAGFGAWRELAVHTMTTNWVLTGECPNFPLMYHWRMLPTPQPGPMNAEQLEDFESNVVYWEESPTVRARLEAIHNASAEIIVFMEYFPENLHKWFGNQISKGGDAADSAIMMVEQNLIATTSFMNERGLLHFDAHFSNIVTDSHRLYFADFGLALCSRFELSKAEREFFEQHRNYDRGYALTYFFQALILAFFGKDPWEKTLKEYVVAGPSMITVTPSAAAIITRYAPIASVMRKFRHKLKKESKTTPYPARELERLCAIAGL